MIMLDNSKLQSLRYGGNEYLCWVAHENESVAYPTNIVYDSRILSQLARSIANGNQLLRTPEAILAKYKGIALIIGIIAIGLYLLNSAGFIDIQAIINGGQAAAATATQNNVIIS